MNRRSFLGQFFKGALAASCAPQILSHGLNLKVRKRRLIWTAELEQDFWTIELEQNLKAYYGTSIPEDWTAEDHAIMLEPSPPIHLSLTTHSVLGQTKTLSKEYQKLFIMPPTLQLPSFLHNLMRGHNDHI